MNTELDTIAKRLRELAGGMGLSVSSMGRHIRELGHLADRIEHVAQKLRPPLSRWYVHDGDQIGGPYDTRQEALEAAADALLIDIRKGPIEREPKE